MSATGENRWRRSGQPQQQRQNNQDRSSSGTNTPTKEGARQQSMSALTGNTWAGKGGPASAEKGRGTQPLAVQGEQHVPVRNFNATEVKDFLKKRYQEAIADQPSPYHKVAGDSVAKRSSGAWGSRGNMSHLMPSGQDFFTQLKKQLQSLEQGKPT
ncbi:hypothetical protein K432DRAFT_385086 [Lepidopterella palustris CBS 459.81]|uniref:Uncharacterized protein n=1 Tax=Lepidopterella palustris CBS 459.81 TaxID=1314670 RepID=A0A8E2JBW4_9PEZI|nr:hypothetical protein K432DRAFT_385086 [Lepidopterella palustris CBS 459.81]